MSSDQIVVWLDHAEVCVSRFDCTHGRNEVVKNYVADPRVKDAPVVRDPSAAPATKRYFDEIAGALEGSQAILIAGPGFERLELLVHLTIYFPQVAEKVVALEAVDRPTDEELGPWARKHFYAADLVS